MRMRFWWMLPVLSLALTACSRGEDPDNGLSLVREIHTASLADANKLKEEAHLKCADSAHCPTNVGLYVASRPDGVLTCTAFLVQDNVIATNSHCVPYEVKSLPDLCASRVSVIFPGAGGKSEETFTCAEFLGSSERPNALSPDLALFRLSRPTGRQAFPVDRSGVAPGERYEALKVNPDEGASGTLVHGTCRAVDRSYRFSLYEKASDPIFTVGDCQSVPGNSGSPLLNSKGAAVGILQTDLSVSSEQMKRVWGAHLLPGETFAPLALGTSLRCLLSTNQFSLAPDCGPLDDQSVPRPRIDDLLPPGGEAAEEALAPFTEKLPPAFRYETKLLKAQALLREEAVRPACFRAPGAWLEEFALPGEPGRYAEEGFYDADLPVLEAKIFFNRYLQVTAKYAPKDAVRTRISFSPAALVKNESAEVRIGDEATLLNFCAEP